jgi:hypothetical protein
MTTVTMTTVTLWSVSRRCSNRALVMASVVGLIVALIAATLIRLLMAEPSWLISGAWGLALGLFLVLSVRQGAAARLIRTDDGTITLIYALRGHDSVAMPASAIHNLRMIRTGALTGIGIIGDGSTLEFRSRKGITRRHCDDWQQHLGVCLVLEHLTAADGQDLEAALAAALTAAGSSLRREGAARTLSP